MPSTKRFVGPSENESKVNPDQAIALAIAMQTGDDVLGDGIKTLIWEHPEYYRKPCPKSAAEGSASNPAKSSAPRRAQSSSKNP